MAVHSSSKSPYHRKAFHSIHRKHQPLPVFRRRLQPIEYLFPFRNNNKNQKVSTSWKLYPPAIVNAGFAERINRGRSFIDYVDAQHPGKVSRTPRKPHRIWFEVNGKERAFLRWSHFFWVGFFSVGVDLFVEVCCSNRHKDAWSGGVECNLL